MTTKMSMLTNVRFLAVAAAAAALLATRCGVDPLASKVAEDPVGATYANTNFESDRPFVSQLALVDPKVAGARKRITFDDEQALILADLQKLSRTDQAFARYFTLTNQWNAGAPDDKMQAYRNGTSKLINSLSFDRNITPPVAIDPNQTILRIDLRAYGWSRGLWEEVVRRDPCAFFTGSRAEREIIQRTGVGRRAVVRADWCALNCLTAPLYNIIMRVPGNLRQLEFDFGIDADRDVQRGDVMRAGFALSRVSSQSRMVEVHPSRFGTYWKSFDFNPEQGRARRNLFEFALDQRNFGGNVGFEFAAGEFIFQLPNGLALYMLADANNRRLDQAITDVVQDPVRKNANVTNAVSCFRCHYKGMVPFKDEIRTHYEQNAFAFSRREVDIVRALYPPNDEIQKQAAAYDQRFGQAVAKLGFPYNPPGGVDPTNEPVTLLAKQFESMLPLSAAAAELGLTVNDFQNGTKRFRFVARRIGNVNLGSTIKRDVFEDNFGLFVEAFGIGRPFFRRIGFTLSGDGYSNDPQREPEQDATAVEDETRPEDLKDEVRGDDPQPDGTEG